MGLFSTKELKQSFFHKIFWQNQFNNLVIEKLKEIVEIQSCIELVILKYSINENNYDFNKHFNTLYNTSYALVTYTIHIIRIINIAQKMKFFINFPADLVTKDVDINREAATISTAKLGKSLKVKKNCSYDIKTLNFLIHL